MSDKPNWINSVQFGLNRSRYQKSLSQSSQPFHSCYRFQAGRMNDVFHEYAALQILQEAENPNALQSFGQLLDYLQLKTANYLRISTYGP
jgi:hypothetical protein